MPRSFLKHTPDLAKEVLRGGGRTLDQAYEVAKAVKEASEKGEKALSRLKKAAPDLLAKVLDEEDALELEPAIEILKKRIAEQKTEEERIKDDRRLAAETDL